MNIRSPLDGRATGLMLVLCLVWSLQQISLKAVADDISPMLTVGLRSGIAALLVLLVMAVRGELAVLRSGRWRAGLVVGGLFALEFLLVAEALRFTHASHVAVFLYTAPIFAALALHARIPGERLQPLQWAGIAVAFCGIALAFLGGGTGAVDAQVLLGDALALAAGAAWGATTYGIRRSSLGSAPASEALLYQLAVAFVLLVPVALLTGQGQVVPGARLWLHLAFHGIVVSFASFLMWFWLLRRYLASRLGVFSFLTPVFGVIFGAWLLDEPLTPSFLAGAALVLAGVVVVAGQSWIASWLQRWRAGKGAADGAAAPRR